MGTPHIADARPQEALPAQKSMSYSSRVKPVTVLRLELLSAVRGVPIGHLIDQMVSLNFRAMQNSGQLDAYMATLEEEGE